MEILVVQAYLLVATTMMCRVQFLRRLAHKMETRRPIG
jgi:hypothetical protein